MKKRKFRMFINSLLITVIGCGSVLGVSASTLSSDTQNLPTNMNEEWSSYSVVTDEDELAQIIEEDNLKIPEGYHLEKVETFVYTDEDNAYSDVAELTEEVQPYGIIYNVTNIKNLGDRYTISSEYDSDWFYGPADVSESYSRTNTVEKSVSVGITNAALTSALGYSVTKSYTNTKTFSTSVASGKKLNVKVYTNYQKNTFDIYNKATGNCVQSGAYTLKPVGLIFKQYTYTA